jgi:hypothetical protein
MAGDSDVRSSGTSATKGPPGDQLNIRDLTERRKFERELQDTQKLESPGLLAGVPPTSTT